MTEPEPRITVVRLTHWPHPDMPVTIAVTGSDLRVTPIEMVEQMLAARQGFFTYETFASEVDDIASATVECAQRADAAYDDERDMAIAYFWYANACRITHADGQVISDRPAPLTREQMAWVFRSLAHHPHYKGQRIFVPLQDGTTIAMQRGEVLPA